MNIWNIVNTPGDWVGREKIKEQRQGLKYGICRNKMVISIVRAGALY